LFLEIAQNISFTIIRKEGFELENLEALLFGFAGFLEIEREDTYFKDLKFRFYYLLQKYQLERKPINPVQFSNTVRIIFQPFDCLNSQIYILTNKICFLN